MNRQEALARFADHRAMIAAKGIVLPRSIKTYVADEWKNGNGDLLAMDALGLDALGMDVTAGPLVTDPNSAIPAILSTMIDPEIIRVILSPLAFGEMLGENKRGTWVTDVDMFPVIEITGEVSSYGDFNENGRAGVNLNWPQFQSYHFQTMVRYGEREIDRAGLAKINYVSELQGAASDLLNRAQNLSYAFGISGLQNYGIINNPFLSAFLTPATKAAGGTGWFSGNTPNATANEVYNDIIALVNKLIAQTNGALDLKSPMLLAMSPQSEIALTFTNSFGVSVADLLKKGYPNIEIKTAPQYGTQTTNNPQGYSSAGNVLQLIAKKIQGQPVAYCSFTEKLRAHKLVPESSAWKQKHTSGTWGTILRSPVAVSGMIGV
jgi:hypothetical protein